MKWIEFVKEWRKDNPNVSYRQALTRCKEPWKKYKQKQKIAPSKAKAKPKTKENDCGCDEVVNVPVKKRLKMAVIKECGVCEKRKRNGPKTKRGPAKKKCKTKRKQNTGSGSSEPPTDVAAKPKRRKRKKRILF